MNTTVNTTVKTESFPLNAYLTRIALNNVPQCNLEGLIQLMRAQLFTVPFENIDVQAGREISLEPQNIINKIMGKKRGGYCYEVNGLFYMAAKALGFECDLLGARPMFYPTRRPKTHMVVEVTLDNNRYLCDLGFGNYGIRAPLLMALDDEGTVQDWDRFRFQLLDEREWVLQAKVDDAWQNQYSFSAEPMELLDFVPANYFNSHHPETLFVKKLLVVQYLPNSRQTLLGEDFTVMTANGKTQTNYAGTAREVLVKKLFGLEWPEDSLEQNNQATV